MNAPFYNHWGVMHPYLQLLSAVLLLVIFGGLSWFGADMRSILKSGQRKQQLAIAGDWKGLENYYEGEERNPRPFVWLHRRFLIPGNLEVQYALFLYEQGRFEEALAKVDQAIERNKSKPWIFQSIHSRATFKTLLGALRTRTLILGALGRYDEARAAADEHQSLAGPEGKANAALALLEYYCGRLDEAIALAQSVRPGNSEIDTMRSILALCCMMKGDNEQALQALSFAPADITKFYTPAGLHTMASGRESSELLELQRRKIAGIFPPIRLIMQAQVYVAMEDFESAHRMLDQAEKSMGPKPAIQMTYCRHRACSFAGQGKGTEAETYLERMREVMKGVRKRSMLWESHYGAARAYLYLKRFNDALAELNEAYKFVLHPIEKHSTNYFTAKAHDGLGNQSEARRYYEMVAADPIPSRMRKQAAEVLAAGN
jgi:tetratricopeptide (TPR) repeat protein